MDESAEDQPGVHLHAAGEGWSFHQKLLLQQQTLFIFSFTFSLAGLNMWIKAEVPGLKH